MSRAFVKDDDQGPEPALERPVSEAPNYVTPRGLSMLQASLAAAEEAQNERDVRYFQERLDSAIVVDPHAQPRDVVQFGATVVAKDERGNELRVRIVGEDEADPRNGLISAASPIAQAFLGHRVRARVVVERPAGPIHYTIASIAYE